MKSKMSDVYETMGNYLSNDPEDYPEVVKILKKKLKTHPDFNIDDIDGIDVWEKVQDAFTVRYFCDLVGIK